MPDTTPQRLHEVMSPVWEVWLELRPRIADSHLSIEGGEWRWVHPTGFRDHVWPSVATALCRDAMVEGLLKQGDVAIKEYGKLLFSVFVATDNENYQEYQAHSLVESLAAACIAVKAAQEVSDGE